MKNAKLGAAKFRPINQGELAEEPVFRPKYFGFDGLERYSGLTKGKAYPIIARGDIKIIRLVEPGKSRGKVLIEVASVDAYLAKMDAQQNPPVEAA